MIRRVCAEAVDAAQARTIAAVQAADRIADRILRVVIRCLPTRRWAKFSLHRHMRNLITAAHVSTSAGR
jgi:hypothetical protein